MLLTCSVSFSQDCKDYYYLQNNKTVEMSFYNKKAELTGMQVYTVSGVKTSGGVTTGTVNSELFDKKGKTVSKATSVMKCTGGVFMVDLKMSLPQDQAAPFANATATGDNIYLEYPASMKEGDMLKDGNLEMDVDNSNGLKQSIKLSMTNRKVEVKESVTTSAGTWECYRISYKSKLVIKTMGIGIPISMEITEWFAPGFGVVKTKSKGSETAITAIR